MNINIERKCVVTNKVMNVSQMIRIVKTKDNKYFVNSNEKGRGSYVSKNIDPNELLQKRCLNRSFKTNVPNSVYQEVIELLKKED